MSLLTVELNIAVKLSQTFDKWNGNDKHCGGYTVGQVCLYTVSGHAYSHLNVSLVGAETPISSHCCLGSGEPSISRYTGSNMCSSSEQLFALPDGIWNSLLELCYLK